MNLLTFIQSQFFRLETFIRARREDPVAKLRFLWGKEIARSRNPELMAKYHKLLVGRGIEVDEQTWQDLAMDEVFAKIDRTAGLPGRQALYHMLRSYEYDDKILAERNRQYAVFRHDSDLRERIQLLLARLNGRGAAWVAPLLHRPLPKMPRFAWLLVLCSALSIVSFIGIFFDSWFILPALILMIINFVVDQIYGPQIEPHLPGFYHLNQMLLVSKRLSQIPDAHGLPQLAELRLAAPVMAELQQQLRWLVVDRSQASEMNYAVLSTLNMFFLFDFVLFLRSLSLLRQHQASLASILRAVGSLDASISISSFVEGLSGYAVPTLVHDRRIDVSGLYHPLLAEPVKNSFRLDQRSALITGSNMTGKTTFIRTLGINVILAQTLGIVLADSATLPRAVVRSSIRREDQLREGKSYFFAELELLLEFIKASQAKHLHLFLIDEIFRGTNTVERLASSTAVLRYIAERHIVLTTTHDLELQELLGETVDIYHFSEKILSGDCVFDHLIHKGPVRTRNAIRLLELSGYPPRIVREAEGLAEALTSTVRASIG